jgi:hypothetical protein
MSTWGRWAAPIVALVACSSEPPLGGDAGGDDGGNDAGGSDTLFEPPEAGLVVLEKGSAGVIALNSSTVFWIDQVAVLGAIKQCTKNGGPTSTVVADHARGSLVADDINVYWTDYQPPAVMQCPVTGCTQPLVLWSDLDAGVNNPDAPQGLALDGTHVYWSMPNGSIMSCAIGGCPTPALVYSTSGPSAGSIAVDANNVYWRNIQGDVSSCPKSGCTTPTVLASNQSGVGIAVDGANVYWQSPTSIA